MLVDVTAQDADAALVAGWAAYKPTRSGRLKVTNDAPDKDGWSKQRNFTYQTSPNEKSRLSRPAFNSPAMYGPSWIYDMAQAVGEKRGAQVSLIFDKLLPKGYSRESFAGKKANAARRGADRGAVASSSKPAQKATGVPGVSVGIIQDGKVVFAGGFGVASSASQTRVDADTLYMIASNTKALTTLMLAKLVDDGKLTWETPVTSLLPVFKLGDADTTSRVLVEASDLRVHRAAAPGLRVAVPVRGRHAGRRARDARDHAADEQVRRDVPVLEPRSPAAAGFVGGHVAYPDARARRRVRQSDADARCSTRSA